MERVAESGAVEVAVVSPLDSCDGAELGDPQEVARGADQVGGETGPFHTPIARATQVPDRLDQANGER